MIYKTEGYNNAIPLPNLLLAAAVVRCDSWTLSFSKCVAGWEWAQFRNL